MSIFTIERADNDKPLTYLLIQGNRVLDRKSFGGSTPAQDAIDYYRPSIDGDGCKVALVLNTDPTGE